MEFYADESEPNETKIKKILTHPQFIRVIKILKEYAQSDRRLLSVRTRPAIVWVEAGSVFHAPTVHPPPVEALVLTTTLGLSILYPPPVAISPVLHEADAMFTFTGSML